MTGHDLDLDAPMCEWRDEVGTYRCERAALVAEIRSLRAKLAAAEQERDAERLVAEQALAGNVDPVSVIAAIVHECLSNRRAVAAVRETIERVRTLLYGTQAIRDIDAALAAAEQDKPKREQS